MLRSEFLQTLALSGASFLVPSITEPVNDNIVDTLLVDITNVTKRTEFIGKFIGYTVEPNPSYTGIKKDFNSIVLENRSVEEILKDFEQEPEFMYTLKMHEGEKFTFSTKNEMNNFLWGRVRGAYQRTVGNIISAQNYFIIRNRRGNSGFILNPLNKDIDFLKERNFPHLASPQMSENAVICYNKNTHFGYWDSPGHYIRYDSKWSSGYTLWMAPQELNYLGLFKIGE